MSANANSYLGAVPRRSKTGEEEARAFRGKLAAAMLVSLFAGSVVHPAIGAVLFVLAATALTLRQMRVELKALRGWERELTRWPLR